MTEKDLSEMRIDFFGAQYRVQFTDRDESKMIFFDQPEEKNLQKIRITLVDLKSGHDVVQRVEDRRFLQAFSLQNYDFSIFNEAEYQKFFNDVFKYLQK